jgi:hypothetical protein
MRPIVTQDTVSRLPRWALLLLCVLYGVPGFFAHDPWRDAEALALAKMLSGPAALSDLTSLDFTSLLGSLSIAVLSPMLDAAIAARIPFLGLLWGSFALLWYACYYFARSNAAQPAALPFGGEASSVDYARAVADGSLLAFMACLGLAEKGHQATAFVGQMFGVCMLLYGLAAYEQEPRKSQFAVLISAVLLCGFDAPGFAALLLGGLTALCIVKGYASRPLIFSLGIAAIGALLVWLFRMPSPAAVFSMDASGSLPSSDVFGLFIWFLWPLWFIVAFGVWKLRRHRQGTVITPSNGMPEPTPSYAMSWHLAAPLVVFAIAALRAVINPDHDAALFIALPALAILAALMLALMPRSVLAAIDWFALALFTGAAVFLWVLWIAAQTGTPAPINNNIERFYPGFRATGVWPFQLAPFVVAVLATLAWLGLMVWRTSRARKPLWKGMVLTAGGVTLTWLLLQTLGAPMLNASRTHTGLATSVDKSVPPDACVATINITDVQRFLLSYHARTHYVSGSSDTCAYLLVRHGRAENPQLLVPQAGWRTLWTLRRPTERDETFTLFRRSSANTLDKFNPVSP